MVSPGTRISASAGLRQAVDDLPVDTVVEDQQRSFGREHGDAQIGIFRDPLSPDPGGIDHDTGVQRASLTLLMIIKLDPANAFSTADEPGNFTTGQNGRAMFPGRRACWLP
ncbi:Uncharacterised protein [Raoultella planticola]|uniref:Uncharacterized protein n=1 Tax=Raoultella planticola TaxID=575 RepID=A0A485AF35_RAOPL|nr:Uncharacterised protein [Raoultella planticola]